MKRIKIIILIIALAALLLTPIPMRYKDGGTVRYQAVLYSVTDYHAMVGVDKFLIGVEVKIFDIPLFNNTRVEPHE